MGERLHDRSIPSLSSHFRYKFSDLSLSTGWNENLVCQAPERWGLVFSCSIGTEALSPPSLFPAPTPYGIMIKPAGDSSATYGLRIDDTMKPININLNTWGHIVTQGWSFSPYTSDYRLTVVEIFYNPKKT